MDIVEVKIKGTVITNQYGALADGTILKTTPEFAKHLVEDCHAAEYVGKAIVAPEKSETKEEPKQKKTLMQGLKELIK
jgi:hypothetical protein